VQGGIQLAAAAAAEAMVFGAAGAWWGSEPPSVHGNAGFGAEPGHASVLGEESGRSQRPAAGQAQQRWGQAANTLPQLALQRDLCIAWPTRRNEQTAGGMGLPRWGHYPMCYPYAQVVVHQVSCTGCSTASISQGWVPPMPDDLPHLSDFDQQFLGCRMMACRMRFDHPDDHPDDRSGSVWSRLDRRASQREQARSVWSHPGRREASDS
jgi:hypothetical protein